MIPSATAAPYPIAQGHPRESDVRSFQLSATAVPYMPQLRQPAYQTPPYRPQHPYQPGPSYESHGYAPHQGMQMQPPVTQLAPIPEGSVLVDTLAQARAVCDVILSGKENPGWPTQQDLASSSPSRETNGNPRHKNPSMIAVDLEGINLSRTGQISLVTVATGTAVYVFDVVALGHRVFACGLEEVLAANHILKLLFDCRTDVDALKFQFNVDVGPICDLQVTCMLHCLPAPKRSYLMGMKKAFERLGVFDAATSELKEMVANATFENLGGDPQLWLERPLLGELFQYSVSDVKFFFIVFHTTLRFAALGQVVGEKRRDKTLASTEGIERTPLTDFLEDLPGGI